MNFLLFLTLIITSLFGAYPKEDDIFTFLDAKFSGDTSLVDQFLSDNLIYYHAPYVGLGLKAFYVDGALLVTNVYNDSLEKKYLLVMNS